MARDKKSPGKIDRLLDELMEDGVDAEDLFGEDGLLKRMKKRMAERILETELTDHLGYEKHAPDGRNRGNSRNGKTTKTLKDDKGDLPVEIPRDREGSFDPKLIRKYQTRWPDSGDKIISMYARGMSTRDIQGHIEDLMPGVHLARTGLADHRRRDRRGPGLAVAAPG
jgi:putative transposase